MEISEEKLRNLVNTIDQIDTDIGIEVQVLEDAAGTLSKITLKVEEIRVDLAEVIQRQREGPS